MNDREAFINKIAENVYDDAPRLVFADWLDEHGEEALAEFIRVQVELEPIRDLYEIPRAAELHTRENKLLENRKEWLANLPEGCEKWDVGVHVDFRRGFPDILRCSAKAFIQYGPEIRKQYPTIRRTVIHCLNGWGQRLSECVALVGLAELELACWYSNDDLKALASSEYLSQLQVLVFWTGHKEAPLMDEDLESIVADAEHWSSLREIVLFDPEGNQLSQIEYLVININLNLNRRIARYQRGYPELFPLKAYFVEERFCIAGHLPDGRPAILSLVVSNYFVYGFVVEYFNHDGFSTGERIHVSLPSELENVKNIITGNWSDTYENILRDYVRVAFDSVGFEVGFMRIQQDSLRFLSGPKRGYTADWECCGLTEYETLPETEEPNGFGGIVYDLIHDGVFVVGSGFARGDKTGKVHST